MNNGNEKTGWKVWPKKGLQLVVIVISVLLLTFTFLCTVSLFSRSTRLLTGHLAKSVLQENAFTAQINQTSAATAGKGMMDHRNPMVWFSLGQLATILTQSSSITTSVTTSLLSYQTISLREAVPIVMGSNVGTTMTSTAVAFFFWRVKTEFRRGFTAALMHDFFNIFTALLFLPVDWICNMYLEQPGLLEYIVSKIVAQPYNLTGCREEARNQINELERILFFRGGAVKFSDRGSTSTELASIHTEKPYRVKIPANSLYKRQNTMDSKSVRKDESKEMDKACNSSSTACRATDGGGVETLGKISDMSSGSGNSRSRLQPGFTFQQLETYNFDVSMVKKLFSRWRLTGFADWEIKNFLDKTEQIARDTGLTRSTNFVESLMNYVVKLDYSDNCHYNWKCGLIPCNQTDWYIFCDWYSYGNDQGLGAILISFSASLLLLTLTGFFFIGKMILNEKNTQSRWFKSKKRNWFQGVLHDFLFICVGCFFTIFFQSSSVFTALLVPLVAKNLVCLREAYCLILGSNLGTTATALLSDQTIRNLTGKRPCYSTNNLQVFMAHILFNAFGLVVFYPLSCPLTSALTVGEIVGVYRWFAVLYVLAVYVIAPAYCFLVSSAAPSLFLALNVVFFIFIAGVKTINFLQEHWNGRYLPRSLSTWNSLPIYCRSLEPWDTLVGRIWRCRRESELSALRDSIMKSQESELKETDGADLV